MSALKRKEFTRVRAADAGGRSLGLIDCGRASQRTKGTTILLFFEFATPPFNWLYLF